MERLVSEMFVRIDFVIVSLQYSLLATTIHRSDNHSIILRKHTVLDLTRLFHSSKHVVILQGVLHLLRVDLWDGCSLEIGRLSGKGKEDEVCGLDGFLRKEEGKGGRC